MKKAYDLIATVLGIGRLPVAPGTWGSIAGLALCILLHGNVAVYILTFIALFFAGVVSSAKAEKEADITDPSWIVIDEFACIFPVFFLVPIKLWVIIAGFVLYRIFDIAKVPPMRSVEKIGGGWGIMLDDLLAGIYSNIVLHILLLFK